MVSTAQQIQYLYPESTTPEDWRVTNDGQGDVISYWNPALGPQPTQAELDAITDEQVTAAAETAYAQEEKAEATKGVDDALTPTGGRVERAVMSVAYGSGKAENTTRLAMFQFKEAFLTSATFPEAKTKISAINWPQELTQQQIADAVKAAIAETPE